MTAGNFQLAIPVPYEQAALYASRPNHGQVLPQFLAHMEPQSSSLPVYVQREFEDYPNRDRLEHGFLKLGGPSRNQPAQNCVLYT